MKIELVGGSKCGEIIAVKYLESVMILKDWEGRPITYTRRDRAYAAGSRAGAVYGAGGNRMYDHVKQSLKKA